MELVELVSPHVAMPVIGVVLCAFIVFAFGFRSPVQPPSFQFEEDKRNKKRLKPTKAKAPSNGHVISEPSAQYAATKASPSVRESKPAASPKAKQSETKNIKKEAKQDLKSERKEKVKKQSQPEEIPSKQKVAARKEAEDEGEWTTVQVPKKSKKQKPTASGKLKDGSLPESAVESEPEVELSPSMEAAAAAAAVEPLVEESSTGSTQAAKVVKKKAKKDKAEKPKQDDKEIAQEVEKVVAEERKKKKKDKKVAVANDGGAAAGAAAALPQEAAPASAKSVSRDAAGDLPPASEETEDEFQPAKTSPKKKKGKAKETILEDKPTKVNDAQDQQEKKVTQPAKKNEKKKTEPKETEKAAASTSSPTVAAPKVAAQDQATEEPKPSTDLVEEKAPTSPVSFDEIGDSWQEAAPKSKKKKPRRDN